MDIKTKLLKEVIYNLQENKEKLGELLHELMEIMVEVSKDSFGLDARGKINLMHFKSLKNEFEKRIELAHTIANYKNLQRSRNPDIFSFLHKKVSFPILNFKIKKLKRKLEAKTINSVNSKEINSKKTFETCSSNDSSEFDNENSLISRSLYNSGNYEPGCKKETDKKFLNLINQMLLLLDDQKDKNKELTERRKEKINEMITARGSYLNSTNINGKHLAYINELSKKNARLVREFSKNPESTSCKKVTFDSIVIKH